MGRERHHTRNIPEARRDGGRQLVLVRHPGLGQGGRGELVISPGDGAEAIRNISNTVLRKDESIKIKVIHRY